MATVAGVQTTQIAPATSWDANLPGSISAGDLLVGVVCKGSTTGSISSDDGWTEIVEQGAPSQFKLAAYWRLAGSSEPSTASWSHDDATSRPATISILRITGWSSQGVPTHAPISAGGSGSDATAELPSGTATASGLRLAIMAPAVDADLPNVTFPDELTLTEHVDVQSNDVGNEESLLVGSDAFSSGSVGGEAFDIGDGARNWATIQVGILDAGEGSGLTIHPGSVEYGENNSGSGGPTVSVPVDTVDGDLLIAAMSQQDTGVTPAQDLDAAFTVEIDQDGDADQSSIQVGYRVASSEPASYTHTGGFTNAALIRITGADAAAPINDSASQTAVNTSQVAPSITTDVDGCIVLAIYAVRSSKGNRSSGPSGYSELVHEDVGSGGQTLSVYWIYQASAGTVAAATQTWGLSRGYSAAHVAIAPQPGPNGGVILYHQRLRGSA